MPDIKFTSSKRDADFQIDAMLRELREMFMDRLGWEWEFSKTKAGDNVLVQIILRPAVWPKITHPARDYEASSPYQQPVE